MASQPISSRRSAGNPVGCLVAFFSLFALAGAAALFAMVKSLPAGAPPSRYLAGLVPLVFLAVGIGGAVWALGVGRKAARVMTPGPAAVSPFGVPAPAPGLGDPVSLELRPTVTPLGKLLGLTFFNLFWNGIVGVAVYHVYQSWRREEADGCLPFFLLPFVLVGVGALIALVQQFLILFNPRVRLTLAPGVLMTGGMSYLQWRLTGRGGGVRRLHIVLEGREEAHSRSGNKTHTDREVFATVPVADTAQPFEIPAGSARIDLPAGTLPSFLAIHNKIVWSLKVTCEIPFWPDSADEYEVLVRPGPGLGGLP